MSSPAEETNQKSFYLGHFSRNNIDLDVIRICFFSNIQGRTASLSWIRRRSVFRSLNYAAVQNAVQSGLVAKERGSEYLATVRGAHAFLYVLADVTARMTEKPISARDIGEEMLAEGICFGGPTEDIKVHHSLVREILLDLLRAGVVEVDSGNFRLSPDDQRKRKAYEAIVHLFSRLFLRRRDRVDNVLSNFREAFRLEELASRSLIEFARKTRSFRSARVLLDHISRIDVPIQEILSEVKADAAEEDDRLATAALASLEADVTTEEDRREKLRSESWIGLAVFCKRIGLYGAARDFYLKASGIIDKHPEFGSAKVQVANALECDRHMKLLEGDYEGALRACSEEEATWAELGRTREAVFSKCMRLEIQSHAAEDMGNYLHAAELMGQCSQLASTLSDERRLHCAAISYELEAKHLTKVADYENAAKRLEMAASHHDALGNSENANKLLGQAHQARALSYKYDPKHSFAEVASEFQIAKEKFGLVGLEEARMICESDAYKYLGLQAKYEGRNDQAILSFQNGYSLQKELARTFPMNRARYILGLRYFEGMILETEAEKRMISLIQKREALEEPINKLKRAGDSFAQLGEEKHAEIDYGLAVILMAVDQFHAGNIDDANQLLRGAKERLPADFAFTMLQSDVNENWQPLNYTLHMMEEFNRYSRRIETEKGFSYESRVREVLKKEYSAFGDIDSKRFIPEDDEVGIVFPDTSAVQVDVFGLRQDQRRWQLLVGEIKNEQRPVDVRAVDLFRRKVEFVRRKYSKLARLESLLGAEVEFKLFVSRSGFSGEAFDRSRFLGIVTMDGSDLNRIARKHGMQPIP